MTLRAAIWAAVSSQAQAKEDKVSIEVQIQRARELIQARGWQESAGPYIVIASRTRWVDLNHAADSIPDLALMLSDAREHAFDVLLIFDYTRLRTLLEPISKTISAYGIQLLSITQPIEISQPDQYNPNNSDSASITEFTASFMSKVEISALKRRFRLGMPGRVIKKGLPKGTIPFGYRKPVGRETDRQAIPEQNPIQAAAVILIKDLFLSGRSLWQIANQLTEQKVIMARGGTQWADVSVRKILKNKFYAGETSYGHTRSTTDPITGTVRIIKNPAEEVRTGKGAHIPLWDNDTQLAIEQQFAHRGKKYTGMQTQRMSGLLYCGICGARMWVQYPGGYAHERKRQWACHKDNAHICIRDSDLIPLVIAELNEKLKHVKDIKLAEAQDVNTALHTALKDQLARKERIQQAYESGAYTVAELSERTKTINTEIIRLEKQIKEQINIHTLLKRQNEALNSFAQIINELPDYLAQAPAQRVNNQIRNIVNKVTVFPDKRVEITFRTAL